MKFPKPGRKAYLRQIRNLLGSREGKDPWLTPRASRAPALWISPRAQRRCCRSRIASLFPHARSACVAGDGSTPKAASSTRWHGRYGFTTSARWPSASAQRIAPCVGQLARRIEHSASSVRHRWLTAGLRAQSFGNTAPAGELSCVSRKLTFRLSAHWMPCSATM